MKRMLHLILCGLFLLSLVGCSAPPPESAATAPVTDAAEDYSLAGVLKGTGRFYSWVDDKYFTLDEFCAKGPYTPSTVAKAAAVDMDRDGKREIVLSLSNDDDPGKENMLILWQTGNETEGQLFYHWEVYDLKADGTFRWMGHRESSGIARMDRTSSGLTPDWLTAEEYADSGPDAKIVHRYNYDIISGFDGLSEEEVYLELNRSQEEKEDAAWLPFPCEDLDELLKQKE